MGLILIAAGVLARIPYVTSPIPYASALEAVGSGVGDPLVVLPQLGVAGIIIYLWVSGKLTNAKEVERVERVHEREIERLTVQIERLSQENHRLTERDEKKDILLEAFMAQIAGHALPAIASTAQALEAVPSAERILQSDLRSALDKLADMMDKLEASQRRP